MFLSRTGTVAMKSAIDLAGDGKAPTEIRLLRAGENDSDYGTFTFDELAAAMVMANYKAKGIERLYADWNHGMLRQNPTREDGESSCSFIPEVRNGELWAVSIVYSDEGREDVESRAYNLFSPAFSYEMGDDGVCRPRELINFALVNMAGLDDIKPLLAASAKRGETMDFEKLYNEAKSELTEAKKKIADLEGSRSEVIALSAALGSPDAPHAQRVAEARGLVALRGEVAKLTGETAPEAMVAALKTIKTNADRADRLEMAAAEAEIAKLRGEWDGMLDAAVKEGKLMPHERTEFETEKLEFVGGKITAPLIALSRKEIGRMKATQTLDNHTKQPPADTKASGATTVVAKLMGNDPEDVALFKTDRAAWERKQREKHAAKNGRPAA